MLNYRQWVINQGFIVVVLKESENIPVGTRLSVSSISVSKNTLKGSILSLPVKEATIKINMKELTKDSPAFLRTDKAVTVPLDHVSAPLSAFPDKINYLVGKFKLASQSINDNFLQLEANNKVSLSQDLMDNLLLSVGDTITFSATDSGTYCLVRLFSPEITEGYVIKEGNIIQDEALHKVLTDTYVGVPSSSSPKRVLVKIGNPIYMSVTFPGMVFYNLIHDYRSFMRSNQSQSDNEHNQHLREFIGRVQSVEPLRNSLLADIENMSDRY